MCIGKHLPAFSVAVPTISKPRPIPAASLATALCVENILYVLKYFLISCA
jgi:hypothetical protein